MWVMLINKLPTRPSPPKLSIFWSEPWIDKEYVFDQFKRLHGTRKAGDMPADFYLNQDGKPLDSETIRTKIILHMLLNEGDLLSDGTHDFRHGGREHNWAKARSIIYKGEQIRIFADEYSIMKAANMRMYLGYDGGEQSHDLVPDTVSSSKIMDEVITGSLKDIYDAALVEGCTPAQAQATALGIEFDHDDPASADLAAFPAIGWYRCRHEYALIYCDESELKED